MDNKKNVQPSGVVRQKVSRALFAILISGLNFLCYLLLLRNVLYLYDPNTGIMFISQPYFFLLIIMKIGFAGFFLSLFLRERLKKRDILPGSNSLLQAVGWLILLFNLVNYYKIQSQWAIFAVTFSLIFATSFLFGLLFAGVIKSLKLQYNKSLFCLLIGSTFAVVIYNLLFAYLSFLYGYCALFLFIIIFLVRASWKYKGIITLTIVVIILFLSEKPNYGQIYTYPSYLANVKEKKLVTSIFSPSGITDVLYKEQSYIMFTDKNSPSQIAVKGDLNMVEDHVLIPYLVKKYHKALYIAVGGGQDIVASLYNDTSDITAVEINPQRVELIKNNFKEYTKGLFDDPRVRVIVDGGRSFLRKNKEKFDLIAIQRPYARIITNSYLIDAGGELFTNEALEAYLNALTDDGILYWGLPFDTSNVKSLKVLPALSKKSDLLKEHMVIFYPYADKEFLSILISKKENFKDFYSQYQKKYVFAYYPGIKLIEGQNIVTDTLFFDQHKSENLYTDRELRFLGFNQNYTLHFALIASILLLLITLTFFRGVYAHNLSVIRILIYFFLGIGYEVVGIFFFLWLSRFMGNFMQVLPIALVTYSLLGSFGYLFSRKLNSWKIVFVCITLIFIFLVLYFNDLLLPYISTSPLWLISGLVLFLIVSILITFPFGYLIAHENNFSRALALDYVGSLFYLPILYYLPNLNYLLLFSVVLYVCVGFMIIFVPRNTEL